MTVYCLPVYESLTLIEAPIIPGESNLQLYILFLCNNVELKSRFWWSKAKKHVYDEYVIRFLGMEGMIYEFVAPHNMR